jgi:hypothetical protein
VEISIERDLDSAHQLFTRLPELGVPIDALIGALEAEGVAAFARSHEQLLESLEIRYRELAGRG